MSAETHTITLDLIEGKNELKDILPKTAENFSTYGKGAEEASKQTGLLGQAAAVAGGIITAQLVTSMANFAAETVQGYAKVESLRSGFDVLTKSIGGSAPAFWELQNAVEGTVTDTELLRVANRALISDLPTDKIVELFQAGKRLGEVFGIDAATAIDTLTRGIEYQQPRLLKSLDIVIDTEVVYGEYAATLGVTADKLSDAEKKQAFMNAAITEAIAKGNEVAAVVSKTGDNIDKMGANLDRAKNQIGEWAAYFVNAWADIYDVVTNREKTWWEDSQTYLKDVQDQYGAASVTIPAYMREVANVVGESKDDQKAYLLDIGKSLGLSTADYESYSRNVDRALGVVVVSAEDAAAAQAQAAEDAATAQRQAWDDMVSGQQQGFLDLLDETKTGWDNVKQETQDYYDGELSDAEKAHRDQLDEINGFYDDAENAAKQNLQNLRDTERQALNDLELNYLQQYQAEDDSLKSQLLNTKNSYSQQIDAAQSYYDDLIGVIQGGLNDISNARNKDLDDLELNYLLQKETADNAYAAGTLSKTDYEKTIKTITDAYNEKRSADSQDFRIQELEYERVHGDELANLKQTEVTVITNLKQQESDKIAILEQKIKDIESTYAQQRTDIQTAYRIAELEAENKLKTDTLTLEKQRADALIAEENRAKLERDGIMSALQLRLATIEAQMLSNSLGFVGSMGVAGLTWAGGVNANVSAILGDYNTYEKFKINGKSATTSFLESPSYSDAVNHLNSYGTAQSKLTNKTVTTTFTITGQDALEKWLAAGGKLLDFTGSGTANAPPTPTPTPTPTGTVTRSPVYYSTDIAGGGYYSPATHTYYQTKAAADAAQATYITAHPTVSFAKGFEGIISVPTTMNVAERGPEKVTVTPLNGREPASAKGRGGNITLNMVFPNVETLPLDPQQLRRKYEPLIRQMLSDIQS